MIDADPRPRDQLGAARAPEFPAARASCSRSSSTAMNADVAPVACCRPEGSRPGRWRVEAADFPPATPRAKRRARTLPLPSALPPLALRAVATRDGIAVAGDGVHARRAALGLAIGAARGIARGIALGLAAARGVQIRLSIELLRPVPSVALDPARDAGVRLRAAHGGGGGRVRDLLADAGPDAGGGGAGRAAPAGRAPLRSGCARQRSLPCCRRSCRACSSRCAWRGGGALVVAVTVEIAANPTAWATR